MSKNGISCYTRHRKHAGFSQERASALLTIEPTTLSKYENLHVPVSQDMAKAMVMLYRKPLLALEHIRQVNPDLLAYIPEITELITDGDAAYQLELVEDDISTIRNFVKAMFRQDSTSQEDADGLIQKASALRGIANKVLSVAAYLETKGVEQCT